MINGVSFSKALRITPAERKYINDTFHDAKRRVKGTEVRDADYALYAAQSCLAKDLVKANKEESELIAAKMNYLQNIINQNMEQDQDIYSREMKDKNGYILTKAEAKSKVLPARAELIKATADSSTQVMDSITGLANNTLELVQTVKTPQKLQLVA